MGLSLRQIEVVRAVLRAGTVTAAARQLGVSQPGLSRVLRNAESRMGLALFERRGGRLHPTPEVLALSPEIEKVFVEIDAIQRAATDLRRVRGGRLALAAIPSIATTVLAEAIGRLTATSPDLRIMLRTVLNYEVVEQVRAGAVELGFEFDVPDHPGLVATELGRARLVCVVPRTHRLAAAASVHARDLHQLPMVSFSGTLAIGAALDSAFAETGAVRRIGVEVGQTALACALVAAGAGVAVVDELVVPSLPPSVVVRPFRPQRTVALFALARNERLSLAAQALLAALGPSGKRGGEARSATAQPEGRRA